MVLSPIKWRRNGIPIAGATQPTLLLPAVTTEQVGLYDVVVTSAYGVATSAAASLALLELEMAQARASGFPLLVLDGAPGTSYHLETTGILPATNWALLSPVTLRNSRWYYVDELTRNYPQRFYRAVPMP